MNERPLAPGEDARLRLPKEPYPGLRPFLDFEAALLFGRERQVREVLEHLKGTQFVAVLGGSGSGKSSLIHAGVIPALRSFGLPDAGDTWLPMACTPGTNVGGDATQQRRHTPVTRLARRFAALLEPAADAAAENARLDEIAELFRQRAGFSRLLDQYSEVLHVPPGPDRSEARVLVVLDQFEELFHPTNRGVPDVEMMVERVLDHFFAPHPRCHVVITMRSEHLNDCAAYLELPDAINKSSYLVRRLDADELREAITGPAQRFLRLKARSRTAIERPLPETVAFEPALVARLLADVQAIAHDPDHLPLLQHLLARLWEAAIRREDADDMPVPAALTMADLERAAGSTASGVNTLRASAEHWPEWLYLQRDTTGQRHLAALLGHLAFKDPNTGMYSQQRIDVDACRAFLGEGGSREALRELLGTDFLGGVDYLFWDDDDPSRVTLKVSHESFIRGWSRFRALIDRQAAEFEECVGVLRKAAEWATESRSPDYLLETAELRRLGDSGFLSRLRQGPQREAWRRLLGIDRDGTRLVAHEAALEAFVDASLERQAWRQRKALAARGSAIALVVSTVLFALLPTALFAIFVQGPTMRRAEQLFDAGNRANRVALRTQQPAVGANAEQLDSLLRAAELVESARRGEGSRRLALSQWLLERLGDWPLFNTQRDFLDSVLQQTEPRVQAALWQLLSQSVWRGGEGLQLPAGAEPLRPLEVERGALCFETQASDGRGELRGLRFMMAPLPDSNAASRRLRRALFVPDGGGGERNVEVFSAEVDPSKNLCLLGEVLTSMPGVQNPRIALDRSLRILYVALSGNNPQPQVVVQEIDWERGVDDKVRALQRQTLATLTDLRTVQAVQAVTGDELAGELPSWRLPGGRMVSVGGRHWRLVSQQATRVDPSLADLPLLLDPAPDSSPCRALGRAFDDSSEGKLEFYETASHCVQVQLGQAQAVGGSNQPLPGRQQVNLVVHKRPASAEALKAAGGAPAALAGFAPFSRVPLDDVAAADGTTRFAMGQGVFDGWLLMRLKSPAGRERWTGAPWSLCALWRMGREIQLANPPARQPVAGTSTVCAAPAGEATRADAGAGSGSGLSEPRARN
jgi:hypothetical protein